jgi:hypothetical protein
VRIAEVCRDGERTLAIAVRDDHPVSLGGQGVRDRLSDARGTAHDDSGLFGHPCCCSSMDVGHLALITLHGSA